MLFQEVWIRHLALTVPSNTCALKNGQMASVSPNTQIFLSGQELSSQPANIQAQLLELGNAQGKPPHPGNSGWKQILDSNILQEPFCSINLTT